MKNSAWLKGISAEERQRLFHRLRGLFFAFTWISMNSSASAEVFCGDVPKDVPISTQDQLKADVDGKAQLLTKLLGNAQIKGNIDSSRTELYEHHKNIDQHQIDMYYMWISCQTITSDKSISTEEKTKLLFAMYASFNSKAGGELKIARNPNALYQYGEPVAEVQGAVISQANGIVTFQALHTSGKADKAREVEYQDWVLRCPQLPAPAPNVVVGQFIGMVAGATCDIIRKRF